MSILARITESDIRQAAGTSSYSDTGQTRAFDALRLAYVKHCISPFIELESGVALPLTSFISERIPVAFSCCTELADESHV